MALPFLDIPLFPDVPQLPGVPPLLQNPAGIIGTAVVGLVADALDLAQGLVGPQWGIFDSSGNPVIVGDSCVGFDYKGDSRVSNYPQEQGAFQSYNKVQMPFDARMTFAQAGSDSDVAAFLASVEAAKQSLTLYTAVTPEISYPSANVAHYDYRRVREHGANLLTVDVQLIEVRVTASTQFSQTQAPNGANQINGGTVQPQAPSTSQTSAIQDNEFGDFD